VSFAIGCGGVWGKTDAVVFHFQFDVQSTECDADGDTAGMSMGDGVAEGFAAYEQKCAIEFGILRGAFTGDFGIDVDGFFKAKPLR